MSTSHFSLLSITILWVLLSTFGQGYSLIRGTSHDVTKDRYFWGNKSYRYVSTPMSYGNANTFCKVTGGQLASIRNSSSVSFIQKLNTLHSLVGYWVQLPKVTLNNYIEKTRLFREQKTENPPWFKDYIRKNFCPYLPLEPIKKLDYNKCVYTDLPYVCAFPVTNSSDDVTCLKGDGGDVCYELRSDPQNWHNAVESCNSSGGFLAKCDNAATYHFLKKIIQKNNRDLLELEDSPLLNISLRYPFNIWTEIPAGHLKWLYVNNSELHYFAWNKEALFPKVTSSGYTCIYTDGYTWGNTDCTQELTYICQYSEDVNVRNKTSCFRGVCYKFINNPLEYEKAEISCKDEGFQGTLARITDGNILAFVHSNIHPKKRYTLGGRAYQEGKLNSWIGGRSKTIFSYFDGTPVNMEKWKVNVSKEVVVPGCVSLRNNNVLKNNDCNDKLHFVCEYPDGAEHVRFIKSDRPSQPICPKNCILPKGSTLIFKKQG